MATLILKHDPLLQGNFSLGKLNFLFTFQVNCPGCFFYGFPVINTLYLKHQSKINFLGLSTAFEDFEYNTEANTEVLLKDKTVIGETKKALKEQGYDKYPQSIDFPIAMDVLNNQKEFMTKGNIEAMCRLNPNYAIWPAFEQEAMQNNIKDYLTQSPKISSTFTLNQFRGTPTFILFDEANNILEHWFGHKKPEDIDEILEKWL